MQYDYTAIPDAEVPRAIEPVFQHVVTTYVSEANKTVGVWRAVPDHLLDFKPPPVEELLPVGESPGTQAYIDKYVWLVRQRLPQLASGTTAWWLENRPFFGGLERERIWVFWRRVLHTCHHRTQVQSWLRLAGYEPVPAIYGPSGDVKWDEADPTYSLDAARRGG